MDARSVTFFCILAASAWVNWTIWVTIPRQKREAKRKAEAAPRPRLDNSDLNELIEKARRQLAE